MAKGSSSKGSANATASSLTPSLLALTEPVRPLPLVDPVILSQLFHGNYYDGDRRTYHPQKQRRPAHAFVRSATRLHVGLVAKGQTRARSSRLPQQVKFAVPNLVSICIRRKARREVLFALNRTRKGSRGGAPRRRNFYSAIGC